MDRLSAVVSLALIAAACDDAAAGSSGGVPASSRVDAVRANTKKNQLADLCDVAPEPAQDFSWPELSTPATPQHGSKYRWVNVWATWCKPCVDELPLLTRTLNTWQQHQHPVALTLVSVDADAQAYRDFMAARPQLPATTALKDSAAANTWLSTVGLSSGSAIPVHLILDAQDRLLCARSGGISAPDLERFERALFP